MNRLRRLLRYFLWALLIGSGCIGITLAIERMLLYPQFSHLDHALEVQSAQRMAEAIRQQMRDIVRTTVDYARWDATLQYLDTEDPMFIRTHFEPSHFKQVLDIDGYCLHSLEGRSLACGWLGTNNATSNPDPMNIGRWCPAPDLPMPDSDDESHNVTFGVVMAPQGPMLAAACRIADNAGLRMGNGYLMMVRLLDEARMAALGYQVGSTLTLEVPPREDGSILNIESSATLFGLVMGGASRALNEMDSEIGIILAGLDGQPMLRVITRAPRLFHSRARAAADIIRGIMLGLGLLGIAGSWALVYRGRLVRDRKRALAVAERELETHRQRLHEENERRRQAQEALAASEQRFRQLVENTTDFIWEVDAEGRYTYASPQLESILGYTPQSILGKTPFELMPAGEAQYFRDHFANLIRNPTPFEALRNVNLHRDGHEVVLESSAVPILDGEGRAQGYRGIDRDVSAREQSERERERLNQELRATATLLETILDAMPDIISVHDPEHQVIRLNRAGREILASRPETADVLHCYHLFNCQQPCQDCAATETRRTRGPAHRIRHIPDQNCWFDVRTYPVFDPQGAIVLTVEHVRDITAEKTADEERRALDARVQHTQKLESLGILAGGIAHDFNNLLVGILGNADLARQSLPSRSEIRPLLGDIERAAKRAADLCRQMLAYSGRGRFVVEPLQVQPLIEETVAMLGATLTKRARIEVDFQPNLPAIEADATQVRQTVMNLLTNAAEAISSTAGSIRITTRSETLTAHEVTDLNNPEPQPGLYVLIEVQDNGCGMEAATRDQMFDPFFTTKFTGRGLGLAAVQGIMRAHHGLIRVTSEVGRGTCMQLLFPAYTQQPVGAGIPLAVPPAAGRWRGQGVVLLADDDLSVRTVANRMLQLLGFSVVLAKDGVEAVNMHAGMADSIVLVILDLTMPQMDGIDALRQIRARSPRVPVLLSSGFSQDDIWPRAEGLHFEGYLQKPYELGSLQETLRRVLGD